ncbi:MAG TPA: aminodeoxychorismate lyase [Aquifex aeolicus]|uniref:Aminodeoxychorismate lyase n=1 Tax=Aquifex aeolicus TaxID=63363 RepID=A0A9D0YQB4_AQUAO|nr:aminodeoxychorismate lyase [Aquificales bacterium]HIP86786.1 aminodeoxychorismate lyase [Aquifex sp.]HIP98821.1 aminodeoxychorismate lyase [Aquifex aeolicus]HIQ25774.1 aminodeoxychorismate lyase [Aquifex aeolicus]
MEKVERFKYFGEGLFETFKVKGGKLPPHFEYHYERLKEGALFLNIPHPTFEEFKTFTEERINFTKNSEKPFYVKVLLLSLGSGYYGDLPDSYSLEIVIKPLRLPPKNLTLTVSNFKRCSFNPLWRFKTTSFLFNVLVKREALKRGFYDAIVLNERGNVTETSSANFYCLRDGVLLTPPVSEGLLPGVTRRVLLESGKAREEVLPIGKLSKCEKFFISNALLGLREVTLVLEQT